MRFVAARLFALLFQQHHRFVEAWYMAHTLATTSASPVGALCRVSELLRVSDTCLHTLGSLSLMPLTACMTPARCMASSSAWSLPVPSSGDLR